MMMDVLNIQFRCALSPEKVLLFLKQTTHNTRDDLDFTWSVTAKGKRYTQTYTNPRKKIAYSETNHMTSKSYPVQALLYLFKDMPLSDKYSYNCNLLSPPHESYAITCKVIGRKTIKINGLNVACFKMETSLNNVFGGLLPKATFWLTVSAPHIPVQYQDNQFLYKLKNYPN